MGCCFCCQLEDDRVEMVFQKFQICPLSHLGQASGKPEVVTGRIAPATQLLISPLKANHCVFYSCSAYMLQRRNDRQDWVLQFTEACWTDFFLIDPNDQQSRLFVPAKSTNMKGHRIPEIVI